MSKLRIKTPESYANRPCGRHGSFNRRLLERYMMIDGVLHQLHATKGWRKAR